MLEKEIQKLGKFYRGLLYLEDKLKKRLQNAPEGNLNIGHKNETTQFYQYIHENGQKSAVYLGQKDMNMIKALAQKKYDRELKNAVSKQKKVLGRFLNSFSEESLMEVYTSASPERKELFEAEIVDDAEYARRWETVTYEKGKFEENTPEYYTLKGERVRSKTEKIIADTLYAAGIPYRYEYPITLKNGITLRPDFLILNKHTRKEYILEHFGKMDDPTYVTNMVGKIRLYMNNGIFPGDKLLFTMETSKSPFSTKEFDLLMKRYFDIRTEQKEQMTELFQ